jgi:hypothetical protein
MQMLNEDELLGIDKNSGFASRVLILSIPSGSIFLLLAIFNVLDVALALYAYISVIFFNVIFLMPISTELQQIKKYISKLSTGVTEDELLNNLTEKETQNLITAINSMHKFWTDKTQNLENRTLSDAAVLDTLPNPLYMISKEGTVIGANLAGRKLFKEDNAVNGIAYICVISVFLYIFCVTFFSNSIGEAHLRFVDQSLGNLYGILNTIIGFYCGNAYARSKSTNSIITTDRVNIEKQPTLDKNK